jgi:hypothetical protein
MKIPMQQTVKRILLEESDRGIRESVVDQPFQHLGVQVQIVDDCRENKLVRAFHLSGPVCMAELVSERGSLQRALELLSANWLAIAAAAPSGQNG